MAQFNIVKGDSSRISTEITPFQEGRFYLTNDGGLYVDTVVDGENKRIHLNPTTGGGSMSYARTFVTGDWTSWRVGEHVVHPGFRPRIDRRHHRLPSLFPTLRGACCGHLGGCPDVCDKGERRQYHAA